MSYESLQRELRRYERENAELRAMLISYQRQVVDLQKDIMRRQDGILTVPGQACAGPQCFSIEQVPFSNMEAGCHVLQ